MTVVGYRKNSRVPSSARDRHEQTDAVERR